MTSVESEPDETTFADLGLSPAVLSVLDDVGYETPSPIQAATIPHLLEGRDVMGLAQTGTGKTAAFALPILSQLDLRQTAPQALVLAPTRELALQVAEAFERYAAKLREVRVLAVYGGQGYGVQLGALRRGVHIVVGTPGRIMDHIDKGTLDLSQIRFVVLDEADEMLKMGFAEDVDTILGETPGDKQVALFSATMPRQIKSIAENHLNNPMEVSVRGATRTAANVTQRYLEVAYPRKLDALTRVLEVENFEAAIVFVRTKNETETLAERLRARGFGAMAINGDVVQAARERTVGQLKDGTLDVLVATDVAARGLDVERISHVINFDIPTDTESYVHRIGRTGRAGRSGEAISFITPRERYLLRHIEKATGQKLTPMERPSIDDVNQTRLARFDEAITAALQQTDRINGFREIVAHYIAHHDVPEADVAAALAVVAQGPEPLLMTEEPEPERPPRRERDDRGPREPGQSRPPRPSSDRFAVYRIAVGKRHQIQPRQIVGALANEGGLSRSDFGKIDIRGDHSLVELPKQLPPQAWEALKSTRISGKLIELSLDPGGPDAGRGPRGAKSYRKGGPSGGRKPYGKGAPGQGSGDSRPPRKPRHKD